MYQMSQQQSLKLYHLNICFRSVYTGHSIVFHRGLPRFGQYVLNDRMLWFTRPRIEPEDVFGEKFGFVVGF
jgi:hypothetical protein